MLDDKRLFEKKKKKKGGGERKTINFSQKMCIGPKRMSEDLERQLCFFSVSESSQRTI